MEKKIDLRKIPLEKLKKIGFLWSFWIQFIIFRSYKFHFHRNRLKKRSNRCYQTPSESYILKNVFKKWPWRKLDPPTYGKAMKTTIGSYLKVVEHHQLHSVRWCNRCEKIIHQVTIFFLPTRSFSENDLGNLTPHL